MYYIDFTHLGSQRKVTGLERISADLFSADALQGVEHCYVNAESTRQLMFEQCVGLPSRLRRNRRAQAICPGFPPSIPLMATAPERTISYIFDLFLLTRPDELNWRARTYMRPALRYAVKHGRRFFALSQTVADELRQVCRADAEIVLYRAKIHNVFSLTPQQQAQGGDDAPLRLISIGTVEPRKNYLAAVAIAEELERKLGRSVELHIVGRRGWGADFDTLEKARNVVLHGYLTDAQLQELINRCDFYFYPTRAEGLGMPVLEVQFSGIPVIANDLPVLRESLGNSALFIHSDDTAGAAQAIADLVGDEQQKRCLAERSLDNVRRWNGLAEQDHGQVIRQLQKWEASA